MSIALTSIITNTKNIVLLKLHLAENRAAEYSEYIKNIKEKPKSTTVATSSVSNFFSTIDHKRYVLCSEYKKLNKLERKLENIDDEVKRQRYERRITRGHDKITYLKSLPKKTVLSDISDVATNEASNNDEASKKYKNDASRSRLSCLQSVAKHLLFSSCTDITRDDIQQELPDTNEKELQTLMLIAQTLQPYIPDKQNRFAVARQIPFCALANDILRATEYAKLTRQLFPLPHLSHLNALQVNAPSLYQMMTSSPVALLISDFNQKTIDSIEYA
ncbi:hypothetical protein RMATCC62417_01039 [Rhizopus microsporus]|nr:hypothetical protein RMATCC62417_01039 [Rhizopus microsporus]